MASKGIVRAGVSVPTLREFHAAIGEELPASLGGLHEELGRQIGAYSRSRSAIGLQRLYSAMAAFYDHFDHVGAHGNPKERRYVSSKRSLVTDNTYDLFYHCAAAKAQEVETFLDRVGAENIYVPQGVAEHALGLRQAVKGVGRELEYSGGAKIVREGGRYVLRPVFSNTARYGRQSSLDRDPVIRSGAHVFWHAHPWNAGVPPGPSPEDGLKYMPHATLLVIDKNAILSKQELDTAGKTVKDSNARRRILRYLESHEGPSAAFQLVIPGRRRPVKLKILRE